MNRLLNIEFLSDDIWFSKPADADLDGDEVDLIARVDPGWSAKLCRCVSEANTTSETQIYSPSIGYRQNWHNCLIHFFLRLST